MPKNLFCLPTWLALLSHSFFSHFFLLLNKKFFRLCFWLIVYKVELNTEGDELCLFAMPHHIQHSSSNVR